MKALKIILIIVLVSGAIFFLGGFFLPASYSVSRSIQIKAADSVLYRNIADFNNFLKWNPWSRMEPSAKVEISGQPLTAGHLYKWNGDETGQGQMEIRQLETNRLVDIELNFIKPFESIAKTTFSISPSAEGLNTVEWTMQGQNNSTMEKWMSLMMEGMLGEDFESGLASLKEISEKP